MPIFEYTCQGCGAEFELLVRNSEAPACPECRGRKLERHISRPARPAGARPGDFSKLGPPSHGGCGGGSCGCH